MAEKEEEKKYYLGVAKSVPKEKLLKEQHFWYSKTYILFEILKELKNREFALLNAKIEQHLATRFLYASSLNYLKMHLRELGVTRGKKLINLYRSNALLKPNSIPVSTYNLQKRSSDEKYKEFNENFINYVEGFDFIVDIDEETVVKAYPIAKEIKKIFDEYNLPYYLKNSGRKGFHLIIPSYYLPKIETTKLIENIREMLSSIIATYGWKNKVDLSTTNLKGLIKLSYSYDSGNISLPLTDEEFKNFKPEMVTMQNVLRNFKLKGRGLLIRTHNISDEELKKNVKEFLL